MQAGMEALSVAILGVSTWSLLAALLFKVIRVMLRHQVGLWASRTTVLPEFGVGAEGSTLYDYRFIIDNVEPVPLDLPISVYIEEKEFDERRLLPLFPAPKNGESREGGRIYQESIRIYSGPAKPRFISSRVNVEDREGERQSMIRFDSMNARDTWTIRLLSTARSVTLRLAPQGVPLSPVNPLRPWLAITTSVDRIRIENDQSVSRGSRFQPSWSFGIWTILSMISLYVAARWSLLAQIVGKDAKVTALSWTWDLLAIGCVIVVAMLWFLAIRRPINPAIQGYRGFRTAENGSIQFEQ
jgi:hypothetical protein